MSERQGNRERRTFLGVVFILLGVSLFLQNVLSGLSWSIVLAILGALFMAAYVRRRTYAMLVPGCILLGLGIGEIVDAGWYGRMDVGELGLGIGFLAIYVIDLVQNGRASWWPIVPGGILAAWAIGSAYESFEAVIVKGWPLVFVVVGVLFLAGVLDRRRGGRGITEGAPDEASRADRYGRWGG